MIKLTDYTYTLPAEKIASYGLRHRDQAKLLYFKEGKINHQIFNQLPQLIQPGSTLFFNNTKVIQARLKLKRKTGAQIEVFMLAPANKNISIAETLLSTSDVQYQCMIGNLKKWKSDELLSEDLTVSGEKITLTLNFVDRSNRIVNFSWDSNKISFSSIIEAIGHTPLPPYINRQDEAEDRDRYQTVYSEKPGAVAAPTAGLHFTDEVLEELEAKGVKKDFLTLHVSAGTFQPIKEEIITNHPMHSERIFINRNNLENLINSKNVVAVGTTALRTLESTYWYGVEMLDSGKTDFRVGKLVPYNRKNTGLPESKQAFKAILDHMDSLKVNELSGETEIFIFPGYDFKVCNALITNFHQPGSTLILLVAAFIGDSWKDVYNTALSKEYRFLSYGDSSLLTR